MKYSLEELYKIAKEHKDSHRGCGGEPYKTYHKLFEIVKNYSDNHPQPLLQKEGSTSIEILELGTGIGFSAIVMRLASPKVFVDTIDTHTEHNKIAKQWTKEFGNINVIQVDVFKVLPYLEKKKYDIIFYDLYGPKFRFVSDMEKIIKKGGLLISANSFLESAEPGYFEELENSANWKFIEEFEDTKVYRKM